MAHHSFSYDLSFKNPFSYTHADASQYLLDHGAGLRNEDRNADPNKINFSNKAEFFKNPFNQRSEFVQKYGLWADVEDELYKMQLKIFDIELHDRCFREYQTRHDIYMARKDEDYRECVDDEPYYCRWERRFYSQYILDHKDTPVIDVLMIVPTTEELRALIDHEMCATRVIRPIIDDQKIEKMISFFRRYMTRGLFKPGMVYRTKSFVDDDGTLAKGKTLVHHDAVFEKQFTLDEYQTTNKSSQSEMRKKMGLCLIH
jgi:hypothetical protein